MRASRPYFPALLAAAFVVSAVAACAGHAAVPVVRRPALVPINSRASSAAAVILSPIPSASLGRSVVVRAGPLGPGGRIVIRGKNDGPPPSADAPAFVVDGRLWCPRRGPDGRFTELAAPVQTLDAAAITSVDVVRGSAAAPYARRCGAPVDAVVRVRTRASAPR
jgi:hypothetical protein